jgi:hypothetical protein
MTFGNQKLDSYSNELIMNFIGCIDVILSVLLYWKTSLMITPPCTYEACRTQNRLL